MARPKAAAPANSPMQPFPPPFDSTVSLSRFLLRSLKDQWKEYRRQFKRCQKRCSENSVHEVRIAIRRLLSTLSLLEALLPSEPLYPAELLLKKRLTIFARLRDTHVQSLELERLGDRVGGAEPFRQALARRERRLIKRLRRKLPRARHGALTRFIPALKTQLRGLSRDSGGRARQAAVVLKAVRAAYAAVLRRHRTMDRGDTATIHRTRVAFKQFRYMVESLQPLLPHVGQAEVKAMQRYQALMGEIQDAEVLMASLERFILKHECAGPGWNALRRELQRRRSAALTRFMSSRDELLEFDFTRLVAS